MKTEQQTAKAAVLTSGKMTSAEANATVVEVVKALEEQALKDDKKKTPVPKTALFVPTDGTRPELLDTRTAGRIMYGGKEYFLTRPQRYLLSSFVYETKLEKTHKADKTAKSHLRDKFLLRNYIMTRNAFVALYHFAICVFNDVWTLHATNNLFKKYNVPAPDDEHGDRDTKDVVEMTRLRIDAAFASVGKFAAAHDLPPFLWPTLLQQAREMYTEDFDARLFDPFKNTVNVRIYERMFDDYLNNCFKAQFDNY